MRELLITLLVGIPTLGIGLEVWYAVRLKRFVDRVSHIRTTEERQGLDALERLAGNLAGLLRPAFGATPIIFGVGLFMDYLEFGDILYAIGPSVPLLLFGLWLKPIEKRAKALKASSEILPPPPSGSR